MDVAEIADEIFSDYLQVNLGTNHNNTVNQIIENHVLKSALNQCLDHFLRCKHVF